MSASAGVAGAGNPAGDALADSSAGRQMDSPSLCQKTREGNIRNKGKDELSFIQKNVQDSKAGTANLCKSIADLHNVVAFVQGEDPGAWLCWRYIVQGYPVCRATHMYTH